MAAGQTSAPHYCRVGHSGKFPSWNGSDETLDNCHSPMLGVLNLLFGSRGSVEGVHSSPSRRRRDKYGVPMVSPELRSIPYLLFAFFMRRYGRRATLAILLVHCLN